MGQVNGKLTYKGQPVSAGSVTFIPQGGEEQFEAGKPAVAAPDAKGEFQLSTFRKNDGVLVGKHVVRYSAPPPPQASDPEMFAKLKDAHDKFGKLRLPKDHIVEIKSGQNDVKLELEFATPEIQDP